MRRDRGGDDELTDLASWLSTTPAGGLVRLLGIGILLPIAIGCGAVYAWVSGSALWFSPEGVADMVIHGMGAKWMSGAYVCGALFVHFHWFWGMLGYEKTAFWGKAVSLYCLIGAMLVGLAYAFAGV